MIAGLGMCGMHARPRNCDLVNGYRPDGQLVLPKDKDVYGMRGSQIEEGKKR